jgi:predicted DCC family thiol-disulfide oxidoreductase YuxK
VIERLRRQWNQFWFEPGSATTLGTCRLLFFGFLFVWQFRHDYSPWGAYSPVFWMPVPLFAWLRVPAFHPATLEVLQAVWKLSLFLSAVGLFTRPAMVVAFAIGTYLVGLPHNFGQTQHFDTLLVFASGALALSRAADAVSIDALVRGAHAGSRQPPPEDGEYTWPIRFVWVAMALIFCAAGLSKLRHSGLEWIFSDNMALLLQRQQYHISDGEPLTSWGVIVAAHPWMARSLAGASVAIEALYPLALFSRRARYLLVPAGLGMLIGIRALMGPTFEQFMMCYVFWIPWSRVAAAVRARAAFLAPRVVLYDGGCGLCDRTVLLLARLDVLRRLRFVDVNAGWPAISARYPMLDAEACVEDMHVIVDGAERGGGGALSVAKGFDAYRSMAWVVPAAWPALPLLYLPGIAPIGRRVYRYVAAHRVTTCAIPAKHPTIL